MVVGKTNAGLEKTMPEMDKFIADSNLYAGVSNIINSGNTGGTIAANKSMTATQAAFEDAQRKLIDSALRADYDKRKSPGKYIPADRMNAMTGEVDGLWLLGARMRWRPGARHPFNHMSLYMENGKAILFVVDKDQKPIVLEDDFNLFPSDTLIGQLQLMIG